MSQYNYPGYEAHKSEHNRLMQHLPNLVERNNSELPLSFFVVLELKEWATVHIKNSDKVPGAFLNNLKRTGAAPN